MNTYDLNFLGGGGGGGEVDDGISGGFAHRPALHCISCTSKYLFTIMQMSQIEEALEISDVAGRG